ncbi:hypothetical protein BV25DRAFT_1830989 [Artomyces pyxidatus]|uniref:Uncharacterized protein n=1 Tax=Artomyces pyxidatus TaxID=48021 RepID=A0ACB8SNN7_9AGAM|nr:hypothetical protein BV25DRAFT_1830989 [Artomyces pyxidatus]
MQTVTFTLILALTLRVSAAPVFNAISVRNLGLVRRGEAQKRQMIGRAIPQFPPSIDGQPGLLQNRQNADNDDNDDGHSSPIDILIPRQSVSSQNGTVSNLGDFDFANTPLHVVQASSAPLLEAVASDPQNSAALEDELD